MKIPNSISDISKKRVLVAGFSIRSGVGSIRMLYSLGCDIIVWDEKNEKDLQESVMALKEEKYILFAGEKSKDFFNALKSVDLVVLSPGVSTSHPLILQAKKQNIPVISEVELAWLFYPVCKWVCITGTDGKTTTTSILGKLYESYGINVLTAGNIGISLCDALVSYKQKENMPDVIVAELSSYQLETIHSLKPHIAIVLNITPDHLDRYSSMDEYASAKARIWMNQKNDDFLIINSEDIYINKMIKRFPPQSYIVKFSSKRILKEGLFLFFGRFVFKKDREKIFFGKISNLLLKGRHNFENMLAAGGAAILDDIPAQSVENTLKNFRGLEHRIENIGSFRGRLFVNDSKATTLNSVRMALLSFNKSVILLMGGRSKGHDFSLLKDIIKNKVKLLVLFGEAGPEIQKMVSYKRSILVNDMYSAVKEAWKNSRKGDVILLSPGCTSFDQFKNFEERGKAFKDIINELIMKGDLS